MNAFTRWLRADHAAAAPPAIRSAARSHVGRVRTVNEDRLLDRPDRLLWAVADGMGGHRAGDVAAQTAVDALAALANSAAPIASSAIQRALFEAHHRIADATVAGTSGTTIVTAHLDGWYAHVVWAGDSRCYLLRDGVGTQLTRDHSVVQDLVDAGLVRADQAHRHPHGNVITRAIGIGAGIALDTTCTELYAGDALLLCSDGVSRSLCERDFMLVGPFEANADRLLANALQRDGSDNASLLLVAVN